MNTLAKRIASRQKELGLTTKDIATLVGVSVQAVGQWESGGTENLKHEHLFALADVLNVSPKWLALGVGPMGELRAEDAFARALDCREATRDQAARKVWERIAASFAKSATFAKR
ncbi:MAG TPA: helix-turn-helix domain-containing protein [Burkholderiales bacterium]|nr:helix-turn-helix domain-containing protein [Burkholderiales bacterium]